MSDAERSMAGRLLATIEAISTSGAGLSVADLGRVLGRDKSSVSRQLRSLIDAGVVERDSEGKHRLGWRLFTLAARAGDQRLLQLAPSVMRRLSDLTKESVHLSVLYGREVLTILSESSHSLIEVMGRVGHSTPVHCTSSGRVLLFDHAEDDVRRLLTDGPMGGPGPTAATDTDDFLRRLREARQRGYAVVDGEFDLEVAAVAAPVRDFSGRIIASLNVSAPSYRIRDQLWHTGRQVTTAAAHLSRVISSPPDS
ncbi:MAG: IclR family transcriptional regulator [Actinomycetota bacterium]|nr:IclR family transcriptional regulator [Actinomycetota bacterium]